MEVKIIDKQHIKTVGGKSNLLIKVLIKDHIIWVNEADFGEDDFPEERDGFLIIKQPGPKHYNIINKKNPEGNYLVPLTVKSAAVEEEVKRPKISAEALEKLKIISKRRKLSVKRDRDQTPCITEEQLISFFQGSKLKDPAASCPKGSVRLIDIPSKPTHKTDLNTDKTIPDTKSLSKIVKEKRSKSYSATQKESLAESNNSIDKAAFITKLIDISTQTRTDEKIRNRLIKLVSDEVGRSNITREEVERIVEEKINEPKNNADSTTEVITKSEGSSQELPEYRTPSNLYRFLLDYNQDPILKYTCHEIDDQDVIDLINSKTDSKN